MTIQCKGIWELSNRHLTADNQPKLYPQPYVSRDLFADITIRFHRATAHKGGKAGVEETSRKTYCIADNNS